MGRVLDYLFILSNNAAANSAVDTAIDSPMEYYFGALALIALVMTWAWLWLKTRDTLKARESLKAREESAPENDS